MSEIQYRLKDENRISARVIIVVRVIQPRSTVGIMSFNVTRKCGAI